MDFYQFSLRNGLADQLVQQLQTAQHLAPHRALGEALERARHETAFCPLAAERAVESLQMDPQRKIGRLKRCEVAQLARAIVRFWKQGVGAEAAQSA